MHPEAAVRTTLDLDEDLIKQALAITKLPTKTAVIEEGLRSILRREAALADRILVMGAGRLTAEARRDSPAFRHILSGLRPD